MFGRYRREKQKREEESSEISKLIRNLNVTSINGGHARAEEFFKQNETGVFKYGISPSRSETHYSFFRPVKVICSKNSIILVGEQRRDRGLIAKVYSDIARDLMADFDRGIMLFDRRSDDFSLYFSPSIFTTKFPYTSKRLTRKGVDIGVNFVNSKVLKSCTNGTCS